MPSLSGMVGTWPVMGRLLVASGARSGQVGAADPRCIPLSAGRQPHAVVGPDRGAAAPVSGPGGGRPLRSCDGAERPFSILNMSSAAVGGDVGAQDLTTRARIRDAAVLSVARHGFGVGLRAIAADAGVSAALILHHFGSKHGLRGACDEHVLAVHPGAKTRAVTGRRRRPARPAGGHGRLRRRSSVYAAAQPAGAEAPLARDFVDHFAADAEALLRGRRGGRHAAAEPRPGGPRPLPHRVRARGAAARLDAHPPADPNDLVGAMRGYLSGGLPAVELFTHGLMTDNAMLDAYLLYVGDPPPGDARPRGHAAPDGPDPSTPTSERPPMNPSSTSSTSASPSAPSAPSTGSTCASDRGEVHGLPRPQRLRQVHHHPGPARAAARRRRHGPAPRR